MQVHAMAAHARGAPLKPFTFDASAGPGEVSIRVSHCGICRSDVHLVDGDWSDETYPMVPGHEVVGTVEEVGAGVSGVEAGQRVGLGWQCGACHHCDACVRGEQNLCHANQATARNMGGFAELVTADAQLVFPIPDGLDSATTAPMLCGGITTFAPLRRLARPGHRVGVVGMGGLGHLGVQWAAAMGCAVTVFSHHPDKQDEAERFGANRFVDSTDSEAVARARCDVILQTVDVDLDWNAYLRALRPHGSLVFLGAPPSAMTFHPAVLLGHKSLTGSAIGGAAAIRDMLRFAETHDVAAVVETRPLSEADAALDRTRQGEARYRMVLEV